MDDITPSRPPARTVAASTAVQSPSPARAVGVTHPGLRREANEDAFLVAPELDLAVVADGIASAGGGAIAAETVVTALRDYFAHDAIRTLLAAARPEALGGVPPLLVAAAEEARQRVRQAASISGFPEMGATMAMVLFVAGHAFVMHAGDSRVHRVREGRIEQITDDHSALNEWIEQHGPAPAAVTAALEHVIVRAVSARTAAVRPDIWVEPARPGDLFLLSTDGLTRVVPEGVIQDIVAGAPDLESAARFLIDAALAGGGPDNVTAALLRYDGESLSPCCGHASEQRPSSGEEQS